MDNANCHAFIELLNGDSTEWFAQLHFPNDARLLELLATVPPHERGLPEDLSAYVRAEVTELRRVRAERDAGERGTWLSFPEMGRVLEQLAPGSDALEPARAVTAAMKALEGRPGQRARLVVLLER